MKHSSILHFCIATLYHFREITAKSINKTLASQKITFGMQVIQNSRFLPYKVFRFLASFEKEIFLIFS